MTTMHEMNSIITEIKIYITYERYCL